MTGLYERSQALSAPDDEARAASAEFAYCELLLVGGHLARRHLGAMGRLGRAVRAKRHARLSRAGLCLGAVVSRKRPRAALRLGRGARPRRLRTLRSELIDRAQAHPCGRLSGVVSPMQIDTCEADLLRDSRDVAQRARHSVHPARLAERHRSAGDDPPPRQDAGAMGARPRAARPRHDPRPRAVPRHAFLGAVAHQIRSRIARRQRHRGRALPDAVRALWPYHGAFRRLSPRRRDDGARHRLQPAQSGRGDAQGSGAGAYRVPRHRHA